MARKLDIPALDRQQVATRLVSEDYWAFRELCDGEGRSMASELERLIRDRLAKAGWLASQPSGGD